MIAKTTATTTLILLALPILALALVTGCGDKGTGDPAPQANVEFVIERGALARQLRGDTQELLPPEIDLMLGQSIVIHNQDQALHYFLSTPVWPGETLTKTFTEPGTYRYSGAFTCSIGSGSGLTVNVANPATTSN